MHCCTAGLRNGEPPAPLSEHRADTTSSILREGSLSTLPSAGGCPPQPAHLFVKTLPARLVPSCLVPWETGLVSPLPHISHLFSPSSGATWDLQPEKLDFTQFHRKLRHTPKPTLPHIDREG